MKFIRRAIAIGALSLLANAASAQSFNPDAYLAANPDVKAAGLTAWQHIAILKNGGFQTELTARLASAKALEAAANSANETKFMFCDCTTFWENITIQDAANWYIGSQNGKTTAVALIKDGWRIQSAFSINAKQYFIVFVR